MKHIALFFGTRPEAIKMAPVIEAVLAADDLEALVVSTGQHREMLDPIIELFGIQVDWDLAVMQTNGSLASLTARLVTRIDAVLESARPDMALVHGDTTTAFVAALTCFYRQIPIGHVEAGLRTGSIWSPFPEEANRVLTSELVTLHFPPTQVGRMNLLSEGVPDSHITVTGNTVIDALYSELERQRSRDIQDEIRSMLARKLPLNRINGRYVLITGHRRENFGKGFEQICHALATLAKQHPRCQFIYPVHLNPEVQQVVYDRLGSFSNILLTDPLGYREFVALLRGCTLVLTDSGGVQEEAPALGKPVLVMRDVTERPEAIERGSAKLVGTDSTKIVNEVSRLLTDEVAYRQMASAVNPYGDGHAAARIIARVRAAFAAPCVTPVSRAEQSQASILDRHRPCRSS